MAQERMAPGRPPLPLDRILTTALRIVDEQGAEALTMRGLAGALNTGTATLYRHFDSRADLIAHVADRLFGEIHIRLNDLDHKDWRDAYRLLAHHMFEVLGRHRGAALLLLESMPSGPNAMMLRERCLATLLATGFPPLMAVRAYATFARYVLGFAIQVAARPTSTEPPSRAEFHSMDMSAFPATAAVAEALPVSLDDEFAFGLTLMLEGLERGRDAVGAKRP